MKIQLKIVNSNNKEVINIEDAKDINHFSYTDSYGANNELTILDKGIEINRVGDSHNTHLFLKENEKSFVEISSTEGILKFDAKVLAFERNNDIINLSYKVNEDQNSIEIKFVGVAYDK